ncbi:MAG: lysophospholipid acyltransferase family protein [Bacteroidota bacterium]
MRTRIYNFITILAFAVLYFHTAIMVLIILPFAYLRFRKTVKYLIRLWAKSVFWILGKRLRIYGIENYSKNKRYIIISNHASLFDIMAIMSFHPDVAWFGHERLLKVPVFNQILKIMDYMPMKEPTFKNTKRMLEEIIRKSQLKTIAIFPEGTRTLNGNMNSFFRGFIYILRASDADILPVTLNGFYALKPKNRFHIDFRAKISVVINKPISAVDLKIKSDDEIITEIKKALKSGSFSPVCLKNQKTSINGEN